jgi:CheY-like chemotaxis protein
MRNTVLLVDDDKFLMSYYVRRLQQMHMEVYQKLDPDQAMAWIEGERPELAAIILDIMMPYGTRYDAQQTLQGLRTGIILYRDIRRLYPKTPVVALTNVIDGDVLQELESDRRVTVLQKMEYTPNELGEVVAQLIAAAQKGEAAGDRA